MTIVTEEDIYIERIIESRNCAKMQFHQWRRI